MKSTRLESLPLQTRRFGGFALDAFWCRASSQTGILSGFGCKPGEWGLVGVSCIDGRVQFFVNGRLAYENVENPIGGMQYQVDVPGSLKKHPADL